MKRNMSVNQQIGTEPEVGSRAPQIVMLGVLLGAVLLRVLYLHWKSPHFDEGINGHFVAQIWRQGWFQYDPSNFHGPLYFYYLHLSQIVFGHGTIAFRLATALLSIAAVIVVAMHSRFLGRAAYWAAAVVALSPGMVFYGRYAIHETSFILAQLVFSYGFVRWRFEGGKCAVYYMVGSLAASIALKETFFILFGTWAIAWSLVRLAERVWPSTTGAADLTGSGRRVVDTRVWALAALVAAFILCALFSGFFVYPQGIKDMFRAYAFWTKTGTGATGHEKPFIYWLQILYLYEWPALLALLTAPIACLFGSAWMRLYTLVGFGMWLAYSLIPYKTPWCVVGIIWPLAFAFGFLITEFPFRIKRWVGPIIGAVVLLASLLISLRLNFRDYHKLGEPYIYVQSTDDVRDVMNLLEKRVKAVPQDRNMRIQVLNRESWPFPFLLERFTRVEFISGSKAAANVNGEVLFVDLNDAAGVEARLARRYWRRRLWIRDSYTDGYAYFDFARFRDYFSTDAVLVGPMEAGK